MWPHVGVSYFPEIGDGVLWHNLFKNERPDKYTAHMACGVISGSKWIANKWIGYNSQWNTKPCSLFEYQRFAVLK